MEDIDEKLIQIHKDLFEIHKDMLETKKHISPAIILIGNDYGLTPMLMRWSNGTQKEVMKFFIKKKLINEKMKGYVFVSDTRMTIADGSKKEMDFSKAIVKEAIIQTLFTPQGNKTSMIVHNADVIEKVEHLNPEEMTNYKSDWDLWNSPITDDKNIQEAYQKFKEENPDKFPDV